MSRRQPTTDPKGSKELEAKLAEERAETRRGDLRWAMENPRGRRLLHRILYEDLGFDEITTTTNGSEAFAFNARRTAAKQVIERMKLESTELYVAMIQEHEEATTERRALRETEEQPPEERED